MKTGIAALLLLPALLLIGGGCTEDLPEDQAIDYQEDVQPLIEEINPSNLVRGSCNMIATGSHCQDYIGSIWTEQAMRLQCEGVGTFSLGTCPYSENGGCRATAGTITDNVLWSYPYGGEPITGENVRYEAMACNAIEGVQWITPEDLLPQQ
ncbi:hypothetical protein A2480_04230 [Candidatus Uhrbacteria bacterium RIFOXYC2_FULL_47_19]|uniref:Lipoprotein n=1 Tax=Candidatus Uhrbacteria bacterium RIFOXYC2_FULL_47_19 TaxID=1802424 RepID=A0A1F7WC80_9BACT|nr:MAG: hypothetical protein A2480_04230 [Candidatus Uhrbacteria bacterium RIFOXYC2_FULL_47_19]HCC22069.1 hypothetical protein [Candidatus Uhrbacteria bacterium]